MLYDSALHKIDIYITLTFDINIVGPFVSPFLRTQDHRSSLMGALYDFLIAVQYIQFYTGHRYNSY